MQSIESINCRDTILVAIGAGKLNDGKVHFNARVRVAPSGNRLPRGTHE
jgi:hypothetical protein